MMKKLIIAIIAFTITFSCNTDDRIIQPERHDSGEENNELFASLSGRVVDKLSKQPISKVKIQISDTVRYTDENGYFSISKMPHNVYYLHVEKSDYKKDSVLLIIYTTGNYDRTIYLRTLSGFVAGWEWSLRDSTITSVVSTENGSVFAASSKYGIYKTTDDGLSWRESNSGLNDQSIMTFYKGPRQYLFAGTNSGVFVSSNEGESWINHGLFPGSAITIGGFYRDTMYLATMYSTDFGKTWISTNDKHGLIIVTESGMKFYMYNVYNYQCRYCQNNTFYVYYRLHTEEHSFYSSNFYPSLNMVGSSEKYGTYLFQRLTEYSMNRLYYCDSLNNIITVNYSISRPKTPFQYLGYNSIYTVVDSHLVVSNNKGTSFTPIIVSEKDEDILAIALSKKSVFVNFNKAGIAKKAL
jgi:hypothetical protein